MSIVAVSAVQCAILCSALRATPALWLPVTAAVPEAQATLALSASGQPTTSPSLDSDHDQRDARAAIERALQAMQSAVRAADADAYLKHVQTADAIFFNEQQNWAADLRRHTPERFDLALVGPIDLQRSTAIFTLHMTWQMPGASLRSVILPVTFTADADSWRYAGQRFDTLSLPADSPSGFQGARVEFDAELRPAAEHVIETIPAIRRRIDRLFDVRVAHEQRVKLYSSMAHLQASIYLSYDDPLGGWNEPGESIKLLVNPERPLSRLRSTLAHEYGHVATFEYGAKVTDAPWALLEGVAELAAWTVTGAALNDGLMLDWAVAGNVAPWASIADFRSTDDRWRGHVYRQGRSMVDFITRSFGDDARNALFIALASGITLDQASQQALGEPWDAVDNRWRFWLVQRAMVRQVDKLRAPLPPDAAVLSDPLRLMDLDAP